MELFNSLANYFYVFPLLLVLIQWLFIQQRRPWIGRLLSLISVILIAMLAVYFYGYPLPPDCEHTQCAWNTMRALYTGVFDIVLALFSTLAGFGITALYRINIWRPEEPVDITGKVPSIVLMVLVISMALVLVDLTRKGYFFLPYYISHQG